MTGSARPENRQSGLSDSTFFDQTPASHVVSKCNITFNSNDLPPVCFTKNSLGSAGDGTGNSTPRTRPLDENLGSCSKECTVSSSLEASQPVAPSFEFYVSSEEGINLFVDLNSNPSDWIKQLRNEVSICQNICHRSPNSEKECVQLEESHNQTRNSSTCNLDAGKPKDCQEKAGSSPNLMVNDKNNVQLDHPDVDNISLMTPPLKQHCGTSDLAEKFEGGSGVSSPNPLPCVQEKMIYVPPSISKNGCPISLSPRFSENSTANPVNVANVPVIPSEAKNQNSNLCTESAVPYNSTLGINHSSVTAGEVFPCCPAGGSMLVADHEVGFHSEIPPHPPSKNGNESIFVSEQNACVQKDALAYLNEFNQKACQKQLPTSIEEQNSRGINGKENPECSQDGLLDEGLGSIEVIQELSKKRAHADGEDQNDCNSPEDKILRSSKHLNGEVLRRRSMRLVSK